MDNFSPTLAETASELPPAAEAQLYLPQSCLPERSLRSTPPLLTPDLTPPQLTSASTSSYATPPSTPSPSSSASWRCHIHPPRRTCRKALSDPPSIGRHIGTVHMRHELSPAATLSEQHAWLGRWNIIDASHRKTALTWFAKKTTCATCCITFGRTAALEKHKCKGIVLNISAHTPSEHANLSHPRTRAHPYSRRSSARQFSSPLDIRSVASSFGVAQDIASHTSSDPNYDCGADMTIPPFVPQNTSFTSLAPCPQDAITSNVSIVFPPHPHLLAAQNSDYAHQSMPASPLLMRQDGSALCADPFDSYGPELLDVDGVPYRLPDDVPFVGCWQRTDCSHDAASVGPHISGQSGTDHASYHLHSLSSLRTQSRRFSLSPGCSMPIPLVRSHP